jgi:hypothetical protein
MDWKAIVESKIEAQVMSRLKNEEDSEYQKFFQTVLKKFKVDSPADLDDAGKKKFFDYIDANWEGEDEKAEEVEEGVKDLKNFKDRNRRAEAMMSFEITKGNTSNKFDDDFGFSQSEMDIMDKLISKIRDMHISSFDGGDTGPASLEFYGKKDSLSKFMKDSAVKKLCAKYKCKIVGPK